MPLGKANGKAPDPEVPEKARRRRFTAEYKLRILRMVDALSDSGEIGALLRREGLYDSHLTDWRRQCERGELDALAPKKRGRKGRDPLEIEVARLRRENARQAEELRKAKWILEVPKNSRRRWASRWTARAPRRSGDGRRDGARVGGRQDLIKGFTSSPMFQMTQDLKQGKALGPLPTVPDDPSFASAPIDTTSLEAAMVSAAKWARGTSPELVARLNGQPPITKQQERQIQFELTTKAIGALRAHGLYVDRLGRQTHHDIGNPARHVNDAIVLPDGCDIDIFGGDGTEPQFHDLDVKSPKTDRNTGITQPGGRLSSSTLGPAEEAAARAKNSLKAPIRAIYADRRWKNVAC